MTYLDRGGLPHKATPATSPEFWRTLPEELVNKDPILRLVKLGIFKLVPVPDYPGLFDIYMVKDMPEAADLIFAERERMREEKG